MKQRNKPSAEPHVPVLVEFVITVSEAEAFWLVVNSEAIAITPQTMASRIVSDVIKDDVAMEREAFDIILH